MPDLIENTFYFPKLLEKFPKILEFIHIFEEDEGKKNFIDSLLNTGNISLAEELLLKNEFESIDAYLVKRKSDFKSLID